MAAVARNDWHMNRIVALGAEMQAASSLAVAHPEHNFLLVSDQDVLDGWDIPNVKFRRATPDSWQRLVDAGDTLVPLCARWLPKEDWSQSAILPRAAAALGEERVVPVQNKPGSDGHWMVKGDRWHRPDSPMSGPAADLVEVTDPHGYGLVYQPRLSIDATVMVIGRRTRDGVVLGLFRVYDERFFRITILQAAESIVDESLSEPSLALLDALGHVGYFTLNWLLTRDGPRLSSFRPVPRAAFGAFARGGLDPLSPPRGVSQLRAGLRFVAQPHYASYTRLEA